MKRKDLLAAGALKQTYAGGMGEGDIFRNVSDEPRMEFTPDTTAKAVARKKFRPIGEALLVRQTVAEDLSPILQGVNQIEQEKPCEGTVLEIGKALTSISVGDTVVFGKYSGQEFKLNDEVLLILNLSEIKGVIYEEPTVESHYADGPTFGGCTNLVSGIGRA
jgi:chaperonin GroES